MKTFLFAAALAISLPAMAQDMGTSATQPGVQPPAGDTAAPADAGTTAPSTGMAPGGTAGTDTMTTQGTTGSMDATTTTGAGTMAPATTSGAMANAPAAGDPSTYPVCSRTVKDRCVNRGARR